MPAVVNVHEAKTHLSRLIERVCAGEEITIAKAGTPKVKLVKIDEPKPFKRTPGGWPATGDIPDSVWFDPLPEEELALWEGKAGDLL